MRFVLFGAKEYPPGSSIGYDRLPSGGYETYTAQFAEALRKHGHDVTIITRHFPSLKKEEKKDGIRVLRVPWIKGFYLRTPSFAAFSFLKALSLDYDVAIASGPFCSLAASLARTLKKKPVIARPAGVAWNQPQYPWLVQQLFFALERFVYRQVDEVVFLSEGEKKNFEEKLGFTPQRWRIIPTGVHAPKRKPKLRKRGIVLFVGRLLPVKGVSYLIKAMKGVRARLWVVGNGPERERLEALAKQLDVDADFFGHQKDVGFFMRRAGVFVLPSISEGLPVALLEAYAAGLPCVVTDIGLPAENEKTALVVPPKNARALRVAIKQSLGDHHLAKKLAENAFQKAKTFSWANAARAYEEVAEKCAASSE